VDLNSDLWQRADAQLFTPRHILYYFQYHFIFILYINV